MIWSTLAVYLVGLPFFYGSAVAGLFGIIGAGGALGSISGSLAWESGGWTAVTGLCLGFVLLGFVFHLTTRQEP